MATLASFEINEWLRFALAILLCIPVLGFGLYLFGLLSDEMTGKRKTSDANAGNSKQEKATR